MAKKPPPTSINQTAIGKDNIQIVGSNNVINRITNFFTGDTEARRAQRNRRMMLRLVTTTWVQGVLEKSLYKEVLIELGTEERRDAVNHSPWDVQLKMPDQPTRKLLPGTQLIDVFDEMNGAMLILGEPGSGKTTTLIELGRDCIARAEQDDTQPIPAIFNLSSWDGKQTIDDWLLNELNIKYKIHKKTAENWVANNDLQLLLDGLDEVRIENRKACVQAINDFHNYHGLAMPLVVCSRIIDYEELVMKLNLPGAILLQPLKPQQIEAYFKQVGSEFEEVYQVLKNDKKFLELLKQPLMLNIVTLAYRGLNIETFTTNKSETLAARRGHLFDIYIQEMFERVARTRNQTYTPDQTKRWLATLAQMMIKQRLPVYSWVHQKTNLLMRDSGIEFVSTAIVILFAFLFVEYLLPLITLLTLR